MKLSNMLQTEFWKQILVENPGRPVDFLMARALLVQTGYMSYENGKFEWLQDSKKAER